MKVQQAVQKCEGQNKWEVLRIKEPLWKKPTANLLCNFYWGLTLHWLLLKE